MNIQTKYEVGDIVYYFSPEDVVLYRASIVGINTSVTELSPLAVVYTIDIAKSSGDMREVLDAFLTNKDIPRITANEELVFSSPDRFLKHVSRENT